jgi:hypothetical protein
MVNVISFIKQQSFVITGFVFGIAAILYVMLGNQDVVLYLAREDSVMENMSALFHAIGSLACLIAIIRKRFVVLTVVWMFLCLIFMGEEVSWFQRVFNYSVPAIEAVNAQNEFNFHNIKIVQAGSIVNPSDRYGNLLNAQNAFRVGFFGYFLILPFLMFVPFFRSIATKVGYRVPHMALPLTIAVVFFIGFSATFFVEEVMRRPLAETREMLYAYFIMAYVFMYIWNIKSKKESSGHEKAV